MSDKAFDKSMAAKIWEATTTEVAKFTAKVIPHAQSTFLGYANITISVPQVPGLVLSLYGLGVKILKGKPFIEFPQNVVRDESGNVTGDYPVAIPRSAELREVITTAVFMDPRVQAAKQQAEALAAQAGAPAQRSGANPFGAQG